MGRITPIYYGKIKNLPNHQPSPDFSWQTCPMSFNAESQLLAPEKCRTNRADDPDGPSGHFRVC